MSNKQTAFFEKHSEFVDSGLVGSCDKKVIKKCGWLKNLFWKMRQIYKYPSEIRNGLLNSLWIRPLIIENTGLFFISHNKTNGEVSKNCRWLEKKCFLSLKPCDGPPSVA